MSKDKTATRHGARQLAFQVLYGLSFSPVENLDDLKDIFSQSPGHPDLPESEVRTKPSGFAWELVEGVWKSRELLDDVIESHSHNWRIQRMGRVELTLLRLAVFEMLFRPDIPPRVAINEALEFNRQFGENKAGSFVNGILDAVNKGLETGECKRPVALPTHISKTSDLS
ncbi:MAG: transcription antitermination factor NusB [Desulfovibrio sp.]|nr:transcription antitermination factor NusB [Desulfovibrio sp.]